MSDSLVDAFLEEGAVVLSTKREIHIAIRRDGDPNWVAGQPSSGMRRLMIRSMEALLPNWVIFSGRSTTSITCALSSALEFFEPPRHWVGGR